MAESVKERKGGHVTKMIVRRKSRVETTETKTTANVSARSCKVARPLVKASLPCVNRQRKRSQVKTDTKKPRACAPKKTQVSEKVTRQFKRTWVKEREVTTVKVQRADRHYHHHHHHHHHHYHRRPTHKPHQELCEQRPPEHECEHGEHDHHENKHREHEHHECKHHPHEHHCPTDCDCSPSCGDERCSCGDDCCSSEPICEPCSESGVDEAALQRAKVSEGIYQVIIIKDSECVDVNLTSLQAAINLQAMLQLALTLILSIAFGASQDEAEQVGVDLIQSIYTRQSNIYTVEIEESRNVKVTLASAETSFSIQVLLQVLLGIVEKLDIAS